MRRPAVIAFLAVALVALVVTVALGARERRTLAFTLGVPSFQPVAVLRPGERVCQQPILPSADFDVVDLRVHTPRGASGAGSSIAVTVVRVADDTTLGSGTAAPAPPDGPRRRVDVGHVSTRHAIAVCIRDRGQHRVEVYGGPDVAARSSSARLGDRPLHADVDLAFRTHEARSSLDLLPQVLERASLFRGGWIGQWLYWLLLAAVALGVPALLAWALGRTAPPDDAA